MTQHTEKAFESAIEDHLLTKGGYKHGDPNNFDRERCLDPTVLIPFIGTIEFSSDIIGYPLPKAF